MATLSMRCWGNSARDPHSELDIPWALVEELELLAADVFTDHGDRVVEDLLVPATYAIRRDCSLGLNGNSEESDSP